MHTCKVYEDCLITLQETLQRKQQHIKDPKQVQKGLAMIFSQVENDCILLDEILKEIQALANTQGKGLMANVMITAFTGRAEKFKRLEADLLKRVQVTTAMMTKDVWCSTRGPDQELIDELDDIDASMFWFSHFQNNKSANLRLFLEAYQSYLTSTFLFRKLSQNHLLALFEHTILSETPSTSTTTNGGDSERTLLNTAISLKMFSTFLKRYGPMKDVIRKASCVSLPEDGLPVSWFQKALPRDGAERLLRSYYSRSKETGQGLLPQQLAVVRYSADARYHFVISTISPLTNQPEHYTVQNTTTGYVISGDEQNDVYFQTILDGMQHVIDKLFARVSGKTTILLPRTSITQWDAVVMTAIQPLPANHYPTAKELDRAAREIEAELESPFGIETCRIDSSFMGVFMRDEADQSILESNEKQHGSSTEENNSMDANSSTGDQLIVGRYMIEHGLNILLKCGEIDDVTKKKVLLLLAHKK